MSTRPVAWSVYLPAILAAVLATFFFHELAHWAAGTALGYDMGMRLNSVFPVADSYSTDLDRSLVTVAGPIFTILQAVLIFALISAGRRRPRRWLYPFVLTPLIMRAMAMVMNVINVNDEGRLSQTLGLGTYTLPVIVCVLLGLLVWRAARRLELGAAVQAVTVVLIIVFSSTLILGDQAWPLRIL